MTQDAKKAVALFKRKYKLTDINEKTLCHTIEQQGYTVIYFNKIINDENVTQVIENLNLDDFIQCHKGFTYFNDKYRLVFINEDLTEEERLMVLAHEAGHIFCEHTAGKSIIGQDVKQEHEANEFSHYLLHPSKSEKAKMWVKKHKKLVILVCVCVLVAVIGVTVFSIVSKENSYYGEYYVTSTGSKYHEKDCIFVKDKTNVRLLTKEEFENGDYEPCETCLP